MVRYGLTLLLCFVALQGFTQIKNGTVANTTYLTTAGSITSMLSGYGYGPVTKWSDGRIEVKGDSLTAIKKLLNIIDAANKSNYEEQARLYSQIARYERLLNDFKRILNIKPTPKKKK